MNKRKRLECLHKLLYNDIGNKFNHLKIKKLNDFLYSLFEAIGNKITLLADLYTSLYEDSVKREISLLNIDKDSHVLHIGCGSLPMTIKILFENTPSNHIVGIDNISRIVNNARRYLEEKNINNRVKIEQADGVFYNVEDFDFIFLSWGLEPRERVLENVFENARKNCKIILRVPNKNCLERSFKKLIESYGLVIENKITRPMFGSAISLILRKSR
jgi:precorrin-6B methylase 2